MFISYKEINANPKYFKQSPKKSYSEWNTTFYIFILIL